MGILQEHRGFDRAATGNEPAPVLVEEAISAAQLPLILTDARRPHDPIVYANPAFLSLTGYTADEVIGRNCRFLQGPQTDPAAVDQIRTALRAARPVTVELVNYRKDGRSFWNAVHISPVPAADGEAAYFLGSQRDVTARKLAELDLQGRHDALAAALREKSAWAEKALAEKTALLQEIDHRVKNNLQLISSLMLLQSRRAGSEATGAALRRMLDRVNAVSAVHRRLFQTERIDRFELGPFLAELIEDLARGHRGVQMHVELDPIHVPASHAAPMALIVSELVTNALRHAYPEGPGEVRVGLQRQSDGFELLVEDHGVGPGEAAHGFGLTITEMLCRQVRGRLTLETERPGLRARIVCPQTLDSPD